MAARPFELVFFLSRIIDCVDIISFFVDKEESASLHAPKTMPAGESVEREGS